MKKEHLFTISKKDFTIQTFKSGGPGGQHQNKTDSGVRITHDESRAVGESRTHRGQHQNKREALKRLTDSAKFKIWLNRKVYEVTSGKTIDQRVDESMTPDSVRVDYKGEDGRWHPVSELSP